MTKETGSGKHNMIGVRCSAQVNKTHLLGAEGTPAPTVPSAQLMCGDSPTLFHSKTP